MRTPTLNDDQKLLHDAASRFLRERYGFRQRCEILRAPFGHDAAIWRSFADMGWLGLIAPAEHGGMAAGIAELYVLMRSFGAALVVEPFLPSVVLAATAIQAGGTPDQVAELLPGIIDGSRIFALAFAEAEAGYDHTYQNCHAVAAGDGWRLSGAKSVVLGGDVADCFVVAARSAGAVQSADGISLYLVDGDAPGLARRRYRSIDGRGAAELALADTPARLLGMAGAGAAALQEALRIGSVAATGEAVGVMQAAIATTADYLNTREQFGRKIASFQALRHRVADMFALHAECNALGLLAAFAAEAADSADRVAAIAGAKAYAGQHGRRICEEAVQMHGAIGITDEYVVGHYLKRILVLDRLFGPVDHQLDLYVENAAAFRGAEARRDPI